MTIETLEKLDTVEQIVPYEDTDDGKSHLTHIVNPPMNPHLWSPGMTAQDIVNLARLTGKEVVALCGYKWIPVRNPDKYPVCQTCVDIATGFISEDE